MPKEFNIYGELTILVNFDVEAETEKEAKAKAKEKLNDFFHLDSVGAPYHDHKHGVEHKWEVYDDYLDEEEN
jgi:hypothetical protein